MYKIEISADEISVQVLIIGEGFLAEYNYPDEDKPGEYYKEMALSELQDEGEKYLEVVEYFKNERQENV